MEFKIDSSTYHDYLKNDKLIVIDDEFIKNNNISTNALIKLEGIKNKDVMLYVKDIQQNELNVEVKDSSLHGIFFESATIKELKLLSLVISEYKEDKFKTFKTYFDNSNLKSIWMNDSKLFNGFLIRNESVVDSIRIDDSSIDHSFTHNDSISLKIEIESSVIDDLNFQKVDIHNKGITSTIDKINIFRTEVRDGFRIFNVEFKELHLHKTNVIESNELLDFKKDIFVSLPDKYKEVDKIEFTDCNINRRVIISLENLKEFYTNKSSFFSFRINFWRIISFKFINNTVIENIFWGFQNHLKTIDSFVFNNCQIKGEFYLSDTDFKETISIQGTSFKSYPSFFVNNTIYNTCEVNFEYSNLTNFVFQNIHFQNVSFDNIDIENVEFKNCEWESFSKPFYDRLKVQNENKENPKIEDLIKNKNIYSKLKYRFQKDNDYITSGKFYISEQEAKKAISLRNKNYFEHLLLSFHKNISSYGESVSKPIIIMFFMILASSVIYLFTGFNSGERKISYELTLDLNNTGQTIKDFMQSIIFSVKNVVPLPVENNFFLNSSIIKLTQVIELIQKIFSLILFASFTESFVRYLKK